MHNRNKNLNSSPRNSVFRFLSSFGGFLVILWTLLQIYNYFITSYNYRLSVKGEYFDFALPEATLNIYKDYYSQVLKKDALNANLNNFSESSNSASLVTDEVLNQVALDSFWTFEIKNSGNKEIKEVRLELPFDGYYYIENSTNVNSGKFQNSIDLGTLRPSNFMVVKIWSANSRSKYLGSIAKTLNTFRYFDDIKVTYPDGVAKIQYPLMLIGGGALLYRLADYITFPGAIGLIFLATLTFYVILTNKSLVEVWNDLKTTFSKLFS